MLVGCAVVLKPSEAYGNFQKFLSWNDGETVWSLRQVTPICAYLLAEAIHEAEWKHLNILEQGITFFKVDSNTEATVDGQNPAPPRMMIIPLFLGF